MILHIFNDQKKFSKGYFQMLSDNGISFDDMELVHYGKKDACFEKMGLKTSFISDFFNPFANIKLIKPLFKADKVIVHSLASPYLLLLIAMFPSVGKKIDWVIWGKDLYFYKLLKKPKFYHKIYESLRKKAIGRIDRICSILKEDYDLACQWYNTKATNLEMITLYPYALNLSIEKSQDDKNEQDKKVILLGNSASKTNNHIEALEKLKACDEVIDSIICPLSYGGSKKYVDRVIQVGKELFGDKFQPLCDFMPKEEYFQMMRRVDMGVYNYNRQEGLGNIWSLILSGKTVYMKHDTSTTSFFKRNGIVVNDVADFASGKINKLSEEILDNNINILTPLIGVEMSISKWKEVFER